MAFYEKLNCSGNVLLQKDGVGKGRLPTRPLPPADWTYGLAEKKDVEGVRERKAHIVTYLWKEHHTTAETVPDRDFRRLNKMSLSQRCTSAKAQREYRKTNDAFIPPPTRGKPTKTGPNLENLTFGVPSLRSDPMQLVLTNTYANIAEEEISSMYSTRLNAKKRQATRQSQSVTPAKEKETQTAAAKEPFKLSRFKQVQPRTSTNRMSVRAHPAKA